MTATARIPLRFKLSPLQHHGVLTYLADAAHDEDFVSDALTLHRNSIYVTDPDRASELLTEAANSADADRDMRTWRALSILAKKVQVKA